MTGTEEQRFPRFVAEARDRAMRAREALRAEGSPDERALRGSLAPMAADAAVLDVAGVFELGRALLVPQAPRPERLAALDLLASALVEMSTADESGARTNEDRLREAAARLRAHAPKPVVPSEGIAPGVAEGAASAGDRRHDDPERGPGTAATAPAAGLGAAPAGGEARGPGAPVLSAAAPDFSQPESWRPPMDDGTVGAFLDECEERLESFGEGLLELERSGPSTELIAAMFRDLHTLKGNSAFAELRRLNVVAHRSEDLVGALREGRIEVTPPVVDALLESLDVQRAILGAARSGEPITADPGALLPRLTALASGQTPADGSTRGSAAAGQPEPSGSRAAGGAGGAGAAAAPVGEKEGGAPGRAAAGSDGDGEGGRRAGAAAGSSTLRIDFSRVDQLLSLVGEGVLARGRLGDAVQAQQTLVRELPRIRERFEEALARGHGDLLDDFRRLEQVLRESLLNLDQEVIKLGGSVGQLRDQVMQMRLVDVRRLLRKHDRTVRDTARKLGKKVRLVTEGDDAEIDKALLDRLDDPLMHLVRNAVDHGLELPAERLAAGKPEVGTVRIRAGRRGGQFSLIVEDDGRGMAPDRLRAKAVEKGLMSAAEAADLSDKDALEIIFRAGFSTAAAVTDVSGRGVGMDVVRKSVEDLDGALTVESTPGQGTRFELRLPLTLAIAQVLVARTAGEEVAIALDPVVGSYRAGDQLEEVGGVPALRVDGELVPVVSMAPLLGWSSQGGELEDAVVVVSDGDRRLGLSVDHVVGRYDVVLRPLGPLLANLPGATGIAIHGDSPLLMVDVPALVEAAFSGGLASGRAAPARRRQQSGARPRLLLAEDSEAQRERLRRELEALGYAVDEAGNGLEALQMARRVTYAALVSDIIMPELDGYELTRALRAAPETERLPIVLVTSKDARLSELQGLESGADAWLAKPVNVAELRDTLQRLLAAAEKRQQSPGSPAGE